MNRHIEHLKGINSNGQFRATKQYKMQTRACLIDPLQQTQEATKNWIIKAIGIINEHQKISGFVILTMAAYGGQLLARRALKRQLQRFSKLTEDHLLIVQHARLY